MGVRSRGLASWQARPSLGEGWRAAALGCFALGVLALLLTRPHAQDRASTIASCEGRQFCGESNWQWTWARLLENASSSELQALQAPDCDPWHCTAHAPELLRLAL